MFIAKVEFGKEEALLNTVAISLNGLKSYAVDGIGPGHGTITL
jgi:hypothetical protein